jgi:hypothetical protein
MPPSIISLSILHLWKQCPVYSTAISGSHSFFSNPVLAESGEAFNISRRVQKLIEVYKP